MEGLVNESLVVRLVAGGSFLLVAGRLMDDEVRRALVRCADLRGELEEAADLGELRSSACCSRGSSRSVRLAALARGVEGPVFVAPAGALGGLGNSRLFLAWLCEARPRCVVLPDEARGGREALPALRLLLGVLGVGVVAVRGGPARGGGGGARDLSWRAREAVQLCGLAISSRPGGLRLSPGRWLGPARGGEEGVARPGPDVPAVALALLLSRLRGSWLVGEWRAGGALLRSARTGASLELGRARADQLPLEEGGRARALAASSWLRSGERVARLRRARGG